MSFRGTGAREHRGDVHLGRQTLGNEHYATWLLAVQRESVAPVHRASRPDSATNATQNAVLPPEAAPWSN